MCQNGCERAVYARAMCRRCYERWAYAARKAQGGRLRMPSSTTCTVIGCAQPHEARGLCRAHYMKQWRYGDPEAHTKHTPSRVVDHGTHLEVHLGGKHARGRTTLVSPADRDLVEGHSWYCSQQGYVHRREGRQQVNLARAVLGLGARGRLNLMADHINGDILDNRRENLRRVTPSQNSQNQGPRKNNTSGARNVFWEKKKQLYRVIVTLNGKRHSGGRHKKLDDAKAAAKALRAKLFTHCNEERLTD